ncbi:MAG TPA: hypothetical protein IGS53_03200 [Leptolyngbyaceae cyanobacterium M33_DOE_097]|uniref:Uncharacterized protein n=1 Tax=Oscillatoriales cyanobacterium SpSt-418 TaxID=2282169 RepID=A0A7C3KC30_9CYAN|nr:hypothetical protein [Leptolyngbyaceae cyanobacterium M33_DOE_097]
MTRRPTSKTPSVFTSALPPSLRKRYPLILAVLAIFSALNISLKADKIFSDAWSFAVEIKITPLTILLIFLFWLPILLPWIATYIPKLQSSLNVLRDLGVEEIETNILKLKIRYGVEAASKNYEEQIIDGQFSQGASQQLPETIEQRYQQAIELIDTSKVDAAEAMKQINQLATLYDKVREEVKSGRDRSRIMREISSTIWALLPQVSNFPVDEKLNSPNGGDRLCAYKYLEWQPESQYTNTLLSRSIGIIETPFGQYAALLALRRVLMFHQFNNDQVTEMRNILTWAANLQYMGPDRKELMNEIIALLQLSPSR